MNSTVSVIMPAYNEGWCIFENIRMTRRILEEAGMRAEIVGVDDGSSDNTLAEIERAAGEFGNVVAARNPYNMGKGMALRTGFEHSTGDVVVFLDADLDLHPSQITTLINALEEGPGYDVVVGSKHHPESKLDYPLFRTVASWMYYMLIKTLFGLPVRDTQTGLKVFRRRVLDDAFHRLLVKKFAYDVELLAVAVRLGYRVRELPVVIDFKRQLKWGRIKFSDVLSLFVDTLAIFYRLRILRYYDASRPPLTGEHRQVLVVVFGCPPPEDVLHRLRFDTTHTVRVACLLEENTPGYGTGIPEFTSEEDLTAWISREAGDVDFIGFLGREYLPVGSWVKSAIREFGDPEVDAVCGPVIPGPFSGDAERAAGMVFSSVLTRGTDTRFYSYKPVKSVGKALAGNLFIRASRFRGLRLKERKLIREGEFIHDTEKARGHLRYDPDVAVSRRVPPLMGPYLRTVWARAFSDGRRVPGYRGPGNPTAAGIPLAIILLLALGWTFLPLKLYAALGIVYAASLVLESFSYFSVRLALPVAAGIIAEHLVRAAAFPTGMLSGLFGKKG